jgi:hypothetical protein
MLLDLVYLAAKTNKYPEKTLTAAATAVRSGRGKIVDGNTRASPRRRDGMKTRGARGGGGVSMVAHSGGRRLMFNTWHMRSFYVTSTLYKWYSMPFQQEKLNKQKNQVLMKVCYPSSCCFKRNRYRESVTSTPSFLVETRVLIWFFSFHQPYIPI